MSLNLNLQLSEEELRALLDPHPDEPAADESRTGLAMREPTSPFTASEDVELLNAMKDVVKTLTVRVDSLESDVGRLRAELAALRCGAELPPAEKRIVVEGVTLPALTAEPEHAAAADAQPGTPAGDALPEQAAADATDALLTPRSARHRRPKKKGFFGRLLR